MQPHHSRVLRVLLLLSLLLAACREVPTSGTEVPRITVEELEALLDSGKKVVIADTRTSKQYQLRHIPGAISIPVRETEDHLDELPKNATIAFY